MKKTLLFAAFAAMMISANAQTNLVPNGDFKNLTTVAEDGQFLRIAAITDTKTQATLPANAIVNTEKGQWYKKSGANGALTCKIAYDLTLADNTIGTGVELKKANGLFTQDQNCLTTFLNLDQNKEYVLSFDFKPTEDVNEYNDRFYVYVRAFTENHKLGKSGIGTKFSAQDFTAKENGWYNFTKSFKTTDFETTEAVLYLSVNGNEIKDESNSTVLDEALNYNYFISNISIVENTASSIATETTDNIRVYASERSINIEGTSGQVEIVDITGRLVKRSEINGSLNIPVSNEGIYLVSVTNEGKTKNTKVMVK